MGTKAEIQNVYFPLFQTQILAGTFQYLVTIYSLCFNLQDNAKDYLPKEPGNLGKMYEMHEKIKEYSK